MSFHLIHRLVIHCLDNSYLSRYALCQLGTMPRRVQCLLLLCWWLQLTCTSSLSMREVDGLVYFEEEVKLDRLEKHIFVWKVDLEGSMGESNLHLEALLAERLMQKRAHC